MVFSSVTFLFLFLPIVLGLYHLLLLPWTLGSRRRIWLRLANTFLMGSACCFMPGAKSSWSFYSSARRSSTSWPRS